jgi:hypothetical protein
MSVYSSIVAGFATIMLLVFIASDNHGFKKKLMKFHLSREKGLIIIQQSQL